MEPTSGSSQTTNTPTPLHRTPTPLHHTPSRSAHPQFSTLSPIFSRLSLQISHHHHPPPITDGYDNIPAPLPATHNAAELERIITTNAEVRQQMRLDDNDVGPPPDGGKDAWACVGAAFFILFCVFGWITAFGTLQEYYLAHQLSDYSKSTVSWLASVQMFMCFVGSITSGRYFDAHGPKLLTMTGTTLSVVAIVGLAFCKEYYQFMLSHILFGFSASLLYSPATAVSGHWFLRRRSTAVGIVVCGSGLGGVIYPIALRRMFDELGYRDALLIIAGLNAVLMLPSWFFLRARLPPRTPPPLKALKGPWAESRYTCLAIGSAIVMMILFTPYFNGPTYATSNNASYNVRYYSIALIQLGSFLGRGLSGILADRFGVWNVFISNGFGCCVTLLAFWTPTPSNSAVVVIGLLTYGFASGAFITLIAASCATISPVREFGMRLGMVWTCSAILVCFGPVIGGALVTLNNNRTTYLAIFCGLAALVGTSICIAPRAVQKYTAARSRSHSGTASEAKLDLEASEPKSPDQEGQGGKTGRDGRGTGSSEEDKSDA